MSYQAFERGMLDCHQDHCENSPFASIGGLDARATPMVPSYVPAVDRDDYLRGYEAQALFLYGSAWRTCVFVWQPVARVAAG